MTDTKPDQVKTPGVFAGWSVVLAAAVGLSFSISSIIFTFGNFVTHLAAEFGWSRTEISVAFLIVTYMMVVTSPIVGGLVDRFGPRRVIIPSAFLLGPAIMLLYWIPGNLGLFYGVFLLVGLAGAATTPPCYAKAVACWFDRRRGLALGISMTGTGIGAILGPQIAQFAISEFGWRTGYLFLGIFTLCVAFPSVWVFLKNSPEEYGLKPEPSPRQLDARQSALYKPNVGLTLKQASRTRPFWLLMLAFVMIGVFAPGIIAHFVPLLVDRGVSPEKATLVMSTFGIAVVFGRLLAGQLMDMFFAPYIAAIFLLGPAMGCAILALGASGDIVFLAAISVGLAIGAEFDVITFLSSRYFGLRSAGAISGLAFSAFNIGGGVGPAIMGYSRDQTGEYTIALWILGAASLVAGALIILMGPYPKSWAVPAAQPVAEPSG